MLYQAALSGWMRRQVSNSTLQLSPWVHAKTYVQPGREVALSILKKESQCS